MKTDPRGHAEFTACEPARGTGGFLVSAYEWLFEATKGAFDRDAAKRVRLKTYHGQTRSVAAALGLDELVLAWD